MPQSGCGSARRGGVNALREPKELGGLRGSNRSTPEVIVRGAVATLEPHVCAVRCARLLWGGRYAVPERRPVRELR